ncbi:TonB family C-terminal domain-containing protein [Hymenobacter gelipurpurascens]|uniref:TonB family C-terminal domain-containing protein n=1 Tax=Hymenobacter gelipurpurascens TaxID=89968 RepID=A0A212UAW0_9BACT|nr:energy transducer TonB [Hymenobacter gelipurpurascens]SNC75184.1 TonB family C-terminal domain-containing protein [Hymenobacter gelipurpurascens]
MKARYSALLVLTCLPFWAAAQTLPAVYLNDHDEATVPDSATHYRLIERKNELLGTYAMREYALNGTLLLRGTLTSIEPPVKNGLLTWYHPAGAKAGQVHYRNNEANGLYVGWYEDGKVSQRGEYNDGQRVGRWISVHRNGQKRSEGRYNAGRSVGEWHYYYDTGQLSAIELPDRQGKPLALAFFNEDGSPYMGKVQARQLPQFPGGQEALLAYVARNTAYPKNSRRKGITGTVQVSYTVDENGRVGQVQVVRGLSPDVDQEARRVVASLPTFEPGREYNLPTAMTFTMPIHFAPNFTLFGGIKPPGKASPTEARASNPDDEP